MTRPVSLSNRSNQLVISAFPATGKTYLAERHRSLVDSDSSLFSWLNRTGERVRNPEWPTNYLQHIDAKLKEGKTLLVSSHQEVRAALAMGQVPFVLVYPRADLRWEYMERMTERGSPLALRKVVEENWFEWMRGLRSQEGCVHVELGPGEYLRWPL